MEEEKEKENDEVVDSFSAETKNIFFIWHPWFWKTVKKLLTPIVVLITGGLVAIIISDSQNKNSKQISSDQQRLLAIQIFNDRLIGNRIVRELSLTLADSLLDDKDLVTRLRNISNKATLEIASEGIWSLIEKERVDAIKDLATLYWKGDSSRVIEILKERMPLKRYLDYWPPVISISNFFGHLERYDPKKLGIWYGTKEDSSVFAYLKNSKYYYNPPKDRDSNMVPEFLDLGLKNFREIK